MEVFNKAVSQCFMFMLTLSLINFYCIQSQSCGGCTDKTNCEDFGISNSRVFGCYGTFHDGTDDNSAAILCDQGYKVCFDDYATSEAKNLGLTQQKCNNLPSGVCFAHISNSNLNNFYICCSSTAPWEARPSFWTWDNSYYTSDTKISCVDSTAWWSEVEYSYV